MILFSEEEEEDSQHTIDEKTCFLNYRGYFLKFLLIFTYREKKMSSLEDESIILSKKRVNTEKFKLKLDF